MSPVRPRVGAVAALCALLCVASSTAAAAGGSPIRLGITASVGNPSADYPHLFAGARAAARSINARGGIDGRRVEILTCNNHGDGAQEVACARKLVGHGVVAMVGSYVYADDANYERTLADAGVADLGPVGPDTPSYTGTNTFPLQFSPGGWVACLAPTLVRNLGVTTVAIVRAASPSADPLAQLVKNAIDGLGLKLVADIQIPDKTADYRPFARQAGDAGAGLVVGQIAPGAITAFVGAARRMGQRYAFCELNDVATPDQTWLPLGSLASGIYVGSLTPPLTEAGKLPLLRQFIADMQAEQAAGDPDADISIGKYTDHALQAWLAVQAVRLIAPTVHGPITPRSFWAALDRGKLDLGGIFPPIDFNHSKFAGPYEHVYNWVGVVWHWDPKKKNYFLVPHSRFDLARAAFG